MRLRSSEEEKFDRADFCRKNDVKFSKTLSEELGGAIDTELDGSRRARDTDW